MDQPIKATAHGTIDYGFAAAQLVAPKLLGLNLPASAILTAFGATQGLLNAVTDTPVGAIRQLPLRTHGYIEAATIPLVGLIAARSGALSGTREKFFLGALGLSLATVYTLTDWEADADS